MIVTIDGPAGAGKSTVAKRLADRLGFRFLDTGAMYRAVTWAAIKANVDPQNADAVAEIAETIDFRFEGERIWVGMIEVTTEIRSQLITRHVSAIADNQRVRRALVQRQRQIGEQGDFVCEGRDQGTVAFPNAECKIFLTASASQRAKRRWQELQSAGREESLEEVQQEQELRDLRDLQRPVGALSKAEDAVEVVSDGMSLDEVVDKLEAVVRLKMEERR